MKTSALTELKQKLVNAVSTAVKASDDFEAFADALSAHTQLKKLAPVVRQLAKSERPDHSNELESLAKRISRNKRVKEEQKPLDFLEEMNKFDRYPEVANMIQRTLDIDQREEILLRFQKRRKTSHQPAVNLRTIAAFLENEGLGAIADEINEVSSDFEKETERRSSEPSDGDALTKESVRMMIDQALIQSSPLAHTANMGIYDNPMSPFHLPFGRQSQSRNPHLLNLINQAYHTGHDQGMGGFLRNCI